MTDKVEKIMLADSSEALSLFGPQDKYLKLLESFSSVHVLTREGEIVLSGAPAEVDLLQQLFTILLELVRQGHLLAERDIMYAIQLAEQDKLHELPDLYRGEVATTFRGKPIRAKTLGQKRYVQTIRQKDIVFGIGPAGTGKTYLAVVLAVAALKAGQIKKIVLTRPAVEAGENLGFLPGDLQEKVDPYLRPLYDALNDILGPEQVARLLERGTIEIAPLAYMRGRTLNDAFVILDEAQNTTPEQMKMFLTRLGFESKMVVTGDITQIDLPRGRHSGLIEAGKVLGTIDEIGFIYFSEHDVVRHSLVQKIITAYDAYTEEIHS